MKVFYSDRYNISLGLLNLLHPFDGSKFRHVINEVKDFDSIEICNVYDEIDAKSVSKFFNRLVNLMVKERVHIFRALEVPKLPFVSFNMLDKRILTPMRFAVQGTLDAARCALKNKEICWNLGGGYHHACPQSMEGFCIYNDIGIAYQEMIASGELSPEDKILIIDTDAHHGNGNAMTFHENTNVTILDVYNEVIYPQSRYTRERVDIPVLLVNGTQGEQYLSRYAKALEQLTSEFKLAFVVAGTDVLISDKLGRLCLTQDDVVEREILTFDALRQRGIPAVFLGGGGYSQESAPTITASIKAVNARLSGKHESTLDATLLASPI